MNATNAWRYTVVGAMLSILPMLIIFRIVGIQLDPVQVQKFKDAKERATNELRFLEPARGQIYDRWGHVLAANKIVYEVGLELKDIENPQTIAETASVVLGLEYGQVLEAAKTPASDKKIYITLANNVSQEKIDHLAVVMEQMRNTYPIRETLDTPSLRGLVYNAHLMRTYPEKSLGSNMIGFVNGDGKGYFGVEEKYNDLLAGKSKTVLVPLNPNRAHELPVVPDGASLVLTFDRKIQQTMEELLDRAVDETGSTSGTIVILDPRTNEIMAMATQPRMDLNDYERYNSVFGAGSTPFNRGVSETYEPGSVYKVLTLAAALDAGAIQADQTFLDTGVFEIGGTLIYNWNQGAWGPQTMTGCMQHSLNVCLAWMATQLGSNHFYDYMANFGIGRLSGVDMAGENSGRLKVPGDGDWYEADLGTNSFGQGVAATPLQMAVAISAMANDGKMMAPHVVRSIINKGYQHDMELRVMGMPIKPETAHTVTEMLATSLEIESSDALVTGYRVAGKTGTAEIPTPFGYTSNQTNASFVGWGPVDDPRFLVYVWLEKPSTSQWGSVVAAPVFAEVVQKLVVLLDLPPDDVRQALYANQP